MDASIQFKLPVKIQKKDKWYVSSCPILDVFSQGATEEEAKLNLVDALELFLVSCFERGTLDRVLKECGFSTEKREDVGENENINYLDVPIPFFVNQPHSQLACA